MDCFIVSVLFVFLSTLFCILRATSLQPKHLKNGQRPPPGPPALPIIGNLHLLGNLPHRSLQSLAKKYGPIMSLRLGYVPTIVVSSPQAAELFLKTHDTVFASRPKVQAAKYICYGGNDMVFTEYGTYWRHVRKLCTLQLLSISKIDLFAPIRELELGLMVESLKKSAAAGEIVNLSVKVKEVIEDITFKMILGRNRDDRYDLKGLSEEALSLSGAFNIVDFLPFLELLDLQGLQRRLKKLNKNFDGVLEKIIKEHEQVPKVQQEGHHKDFVDVLLSLMNQPMNPHEEAVHILDRTKIKAILLDMLVSAIDSSATTIEWAFSQLLRHPRVMKKLQDELGKVVGMNKLVEEEHLGKLCYMDMVVKETLRLYPVAPLLIPHESLEDITVNGYYIKKKSRIIVNAWTIGRDPNVWSDNAEEFYPERFINIDIELPSHDLRLIPFGSGRRGCPGMQLGLRTVRIFIAQLVHCCNWKLPNGMLPSELDMNEKFGLTIPRVKHLLAKPSYRLRL
ncbi:Cytochrome P450 [Quillaja saponaria]|uniref:Cytochrome P450 n=1 Tax=Quillaja saponaria TaxID=32244 RepID=A0AAD7PWR6_QUISA|nr:Cytochrome P450 [Quillaja saponaria]